LIIADNHEEKFQQKKIILQFEKSIFVQGMLFYLNRRLLRPMGER